MAHGKMIGIGNDGIKSLPLNNVEAWVDAGFGEWFSGNNAGRITAPSAFTASGWTYRCVQVRSAALTAVPWSVYRGDNEVYASDGDNAEQRTDLDWLRNIKTLLYVTEAALSIVGEAYWHKVRTRGRRIDSLKYLAPGTMTPNWGASGIETFDRQIDSMRYRLPADDVLYYRLPNPMHETDPGVSPVEAALSDIGVMVNLNTFAAAFFKRGAIRTTLLTVDGVPQPAEREKLKAWWQRAVAGIGNAFSTEVVSASVTPVVVGDGIESLNNEALTTEKRESISTALGVPHSLVLSNAANFATAEADRLTFYDMTILPEAEIIAEVMNQQLFEPLGLRFAFRPKAMNIYQENEEQRAGAFAAYVNAGMPKSLVAEMLGIDLPPGWEYTDLDPQAPPPAVQPEAEDTEPADMAATPEDEANSEDGAAKRAEIKALKKWLKKRVDPDLAQFNVEFLSDEEKHAIAAEMGQCDGDACEHAHGHMHDMPIKAMQLGNPMIDPVLTQYEQDLQSLIEEAVTGVEDKPDFERRMRDIVMAALLLSFLRGVGADDESELIPEQRAALRAERNRANEAVSSVSDDIYNADRYAPRDSGQGRRPQTAREGIERAFGRIGLWVTTLAGMFAVGQLLSDGNKLYQWQLGRTVEHCADCARLNGQVHTAVEWRAAGWHPQGRNLQCGGWNCDCRLVEMPEGTETRGGF